jgi:hypothetical protein
MELGTSRQPVETGPGKGLEETHRNITPVIIVIKRMQEMPVQPNPGYFIFSLDTELSVGFFDYDRERHEIFSKDGQRERGSIRSVLSLCEKYNIAATWAIVGHIFYESCEYCQRCPIQAWKGKYQSYEEAYGTAHPLWYGADVIQNILSSPQPKEIGFHGYTHQVFTESKMNAEDAQFEIDEWKRLASRHDLTATSLVFPRNAIGHLDVVKDSGFLCYRGHDRIPRLYELIPILESFDHILSLSKLPIYDVDASAIDPNGLVCLPGSQHLFNYNRSMEIILDKLNFHKLRLNRIFKGIRKAATEGKMVHLWAHPWEFRTEKDIEKLDAILSFAAAEIAKGSMRSVTMTEMARIILDQKATAKER